MLQFSFACGLKPLAYGKASPEVQLKDGIFDDIMKSICKKLCLLPYEAKLRWLKKLRQGTLRPQIPSADSDFQAFPTVALITDGKLKSKYKGEAGSVI